MKSFTLKNEKGEEIVISNVPDEAVVAMEVISRSNGYPVNSFVLKVGENTLMVYPAVAAFWERTIHVGKPHKALWIEENKE